MVAGRRTVVLIFLDSGRTEVCLQGPPVSQAAGRIQTEAGARNSPQRKGQVQWCVCKGKTQTNNLQHKLRGRVRFRPDAAEQEKHTQTQGNTQCTCTYNKATAEIDLRRKKGTMCLQTKVIPLATCGDLCVTHRPSVYALCVCSLSAEELQLPSIFTNERKRTENLFCNYSPRSKFSV